MKWFCCLSVPGAVFFIIWPRMLILNLLGKKFVGAEPAMQWFGVAFVPMFVSSLFPFIFTALSLPGVFCLAMALALVVRVGAELAVVPSLGYIGACVVGVFSELGAFAILPTFQAKAIRFGGQFLVKPFWPAFHGGDPFPGSAASALPALPSLQRLGRIYRRSVLLRTFPVMSCGLCGGSRFC
jgi:O-antigen/teichoic acid export membrane protein